jgi:hypothetical protein
MALLSKIQNLLKEQANSRELLRDARVRTYFNFELGRTQIGISLLDKLLKEGPYFPIASPTLNMFSLLQVVNDAVVNRRQCYVEFGAGISTLVMARLKRLNGLDMQIVVVESDKGWLDLVQGFLRDEGLDHLVEMVYAPLGDARVFHKNKTAWYDRQAIEKALEGKPAPDLVLVDGPFAYNEELKYARFPAWDCLKDRLADSFTFFLDDINRKGEMEILDLWAKESGLEKTVLSSTFGLIHKNLRFYPFYQ